MDKYAFRIERYEAGIKKLLLLREPFAGGHACDGFEGAIERSVAREA